MPKSVRTPEQRAHRAAWRKAWDAQRRAAQGPSLPKPLPKTPEQRRAAVLAYRAKRREARTATAVPPELRAMPEPPVRGRIRGDLAWLDHKLRYAAMRLLAECMRNAPWGMTV